MMCKPVRLQKRDLCDMCIHRTGSENSWSCEVGDGVVVDDDGFKGVIDADDDGILKIIECSRYDRYNMPKFGEVE